MKKDVGREIASSLNFFLIPTNRFAGRPGDYVYVFNRYRMEEVSYKVSLCDYLHLLFCYHCYNPVITVFATVVITSILEGISISVSFSFFSFPVCPWWLSYWVMYSAQHHHVGKTAHSEQYIWDWHPVSNQSVHYISLCKACSVVPYLCITWKIQYLQLG